MMMEEKKKKAIASSGGSRSNQYLPEDLVIDIQRRLKLSGLRRLCCVSKSWNSTLSNPNFVYGSIQDEDPNAQILITIPTKEKPPKCVYTCVPYDSLLDINNESTFREFPGQTPDRVVGCGGGLICFQSGRDLGLFNPATRETKMLPPLPQVWFRAPTFGFVMMETNREEEEEEEEEEEDRYYRYKVVCIFRGHQPWRGFSCKVYVFSSDDESLGWKNLLSVENYYPFSLYATTYWEDILLSRRITFGNQIPQYGCATKEKNKCYWIAYNERNNSANNSASLNLVTFDPGTEVFHVGETLAFDRSGDGLGFPSAYMVKEETLVVMFNSSRDVWVMQQLDVAESWCKLFTIPLLSNEMRPIGLWKHGKVIYEANNKNVLQVLDVTTSPTETSTTTLDQLVSDNDRHRTHQTQVTIYTPSEKSLSSRRVRAKTLLLLGISSTLKDILLGSGSSANASVPPALNRPAEQVFEIFNLANELLPPLPHGTISLPVSSNTLVKGPLVKKSSTSGSGKHDDLDGDAAEISARERLITDQPELLQQFSMDLLPVLMHVDIHFVGRRRYC
ncbi:E3 ubiquitin-protein ligase UPL3 [Linum grandiflorum]